MTEKKPKDRTLASSNAAGNTPKRQGSVTIRDIAKLVGVTPATVSRAINYPERLAAGTLEKINEAIARTGYVPNQLAGALATRRSHLIAAISPHIANHVYSEIVDGLTTVLRDSGYQVLLGQTEYNEELEEDLVRTILGRKPDGIFIIGSNHTSTCKRLLLNSSIPIVESWDLTQTPLDLMVGISHIQVGHATADYLLSRGHKEFGVIFGTDYRSQLRKKAFIETVGRDQTNKIYVIDSPVPAGFRNGRETFASLVDEQGFSRGAIACSSDYLAHGIMEEAKHRGMDVPGQVAVIGFGDMAFSECTTPPLTTVHVNRKKIGQLSGRILLDKISGNTVPEPIIDVGFYIVTRETT